MKAAGYDEICEELYLEVCGYEEFVYDDDIVVADGEIYSIDFQFYWEPLSEEDLYYLDKYDYYHDVYYV